MSSRKGAANPFVAGGINNPSSKGKDVSGVSSPKVEQLSQGVADMNLDSAQDDGWWEVIQRKPKNRAGSSAARPWGAQTSNPKPQGGMRPNSGSGRATGNAWATHNSDSRMATGRGNARPQTFNSSFQNNHVPAHPFIRPPLEHGWNWQSRAGSNPSKGLRDDCGKDNVNTEVEKDNDIDDVEDDSDDDAVDDSDDELLTDDFGSDSSQKSQETRKQNRWFKKFFEGLDSMSIEEINDPARQWHCPACHGGPGAIDWYRGLQPLVTHAKTKGAKRVKLHRELAELLDEELHRRGVLVIPAGEAFGKWRGLKDEEKDYEIVWPPMVMIMNTRLEQDENDKWIGMGNQELLEYFSSYAAVKARHSYGPQGHRGMSVLIFESTGRGYLEAERLHKHFAEQGTDKEAWEHHRVLFHPGGKRQLYGYLAMKEDLDSFNQHSQGKSRLKFEMRSYQEMVVKQIRQMSEDNQQLIFYKNKVAKEQKLKSALEESFGFVSEKLRQTMEENRIVRQRTKMQHEQNKEEMDFQEQFFKEQIKFIHEARDEKEENFEKLQQQQREKVKQSNPNPSNTEEYRRRADEIAKFIKFQDEEMEAFVGERDKLIKAHEEKMAAMRQRHWQEEVELEKVFDTELSHLMEKYTPDTSKVSTGDA
ncbi:protein SUPPRESSOR OF GENE SILENCING 3-like [Durio zibethinus]|uniref:Protein SUPPRESSOR OF GENE SILENCING 3-like n=1 Tax=Durio zibethinus TaxID=66656 RepID=A0A6P6BCF9_DURZI|nr:protein SUPPRESSOR OF GENE SILENCING 3-like [Durio zibethinus]XP_022774793.1 protein SUPPRESSOR OF GENE SILENCING 3-like [Durio zibethinus]XP_022774794.1 protein SUPPRESSOR OF GENE SILENCING 3-like [Durio zibethinus]XP_022774795.1 protein SUPPRESSOR OF GENE SILENCING 3-like [Durio zibethinus]